jgi:DNA repair protein RecO (recombination protein O)
MSESVTLNGMVISSMPMGENDRRIVLLTKERGKISAFARGARKAKSILSAASNPFAFGTYSAFEGRNSYTVVNAEVKRYFDKLSKDYDAICLASYFLEVADYFSNENVDESQRLNLLYLSLSALESEKYDMKLVKRIYELRTLRLNGEYPNVFECSECSEKENLVLIDSHFEGIICENCRKEGMMGHFVSKDLLYVIQFILSVDEKKLFSFKLTDDLLEEFDSFMEKLWRHNVNHQFKSEKFL